MTIEFAKPVHTIRVRELVEFVLRRGDLARERNFVGTDRVMRGIRGHQKVQRARPPGYQMEVPIEHQFDAGDFMLLIRGRMDGLLVSASELLVEEIKTVEGAWDSQPDSLHWAQAKIYAFMRASSDGLEGATVQLVYLQLETERITEFRETFSFSQLTEFFQDTTNTYLAWIREERNWWQERDESIHSVSFPFPNYRTGQRELAVASYRVLANGGNLFVTAPTGIGKTISVLFPAVKALGARKLERVFYLTARTIGRTIAEKALAELRRHGLKVRSVTLTAKEKVCVRLGQPCDPLTCPMALGYYDRIKPAMREALEQEHMDRATLERVAQKHQVCPFELALDVSEWAEVVIGDYNYVFDPQVYLRRHFIEGGDYGFLVDEAHNLVDRAREMFSAELDGGEIQEVKRAVQRTIPKCARTLGKLYTALSEMRREETL
jgi:DNA excision repair protein ERCC-2